MVYLQFFMDLPVSFLMVASLTIVVESPFVIQVSRKDIDVVCFLYYMDLSVGSTPIWLSLY
jgi:hypothetical protein